MIGAWRTCLGAVTIPMDSWRWLATERLAGAILLHHFSALSSLGCQCVGLQRPAEGYIKYQSYSIEIIKFIHILEYEECSYQIRIDFNRFESFIKLIYACYVPVYWP